MATLKSIKRWFWWHKWTSLICTAFLLLLCLTGLPLIFHEEIEHLTEKEPNVQLPSSSTAKPLDDLLKTAKARFPGLVEKLVYWDKEHPGLISITLGKSAGS